MEVLPEYEESHLVVAAVRILSHRDGRSPTPEDVAGLLGFSREKLYVLVHELRRLGILRGLETPFELRLDVGDPAQLETLPRSGEGPTIEGQLTEFHAKEKKKREEMERMLRGGEADRRRQERVAKLEQEFMKFKPKAGALEGLFKAPADAPGGDEPGSDEAAPTKKPATGKPKGGGKPEKDG
jgi:hypothetical protein